MYERAREAVELPAVSEALLAFLVDECDFDVEHAEGSLGVAVGDTTDDGLVTLEAAECLAACTEAPCLQVNYRYEYRVDGDRFDALVDDLRAGRRDDIPPHGTLARIRQRIPDDRRAGVVVPEDDREPVWMQATDGGGEG